MRAGRHPLEAGEIGSDRLSEEGKMNTGAWVGILGTAVVLFALIATLVPRIREHRVEQERLRAIDEFHRRHESTSERDRHEAPH